MILTTLLIASSCGFSLQTLPAPEPILPEEEGIAPVAIPLRSSADRALEGLLDTMDLYGSLRVRFIEADSESELQNGSSRVGARIRRELDSGFAVVGRVEWQVNLVDNPTILTVSESTDSALQSTRNRNAFDTRLGWLGLDLNEYGRFQFGKQWSPYYDVAGWTDRFNVFGAAALGAFTSGTDGGETGSGRSEQAMVWRGEYDELKLAVQYQAQGLGSQSSESYAGSLRYAPTSWMELGAAFNEVKLGDVGGVVAFDDDPRALIAGVKMTFDRWSVAAAYSDQRQFELGTAGSQATLFDAEGYELYLSYAASERLSLYGGGNWRSADDDGIDGNSDIEDYLLGAQWNLDESTMAYIQGRAAEERGVDALVLGLRYNF